MLTTAVERVLLLCGCPNFLNPLSSHRHSQDRSKLQQMSFKGLIDVARGRGLTYSKQGHQFDKSELEEHILEAQTFAASLRAKHPVSLERGASAGGGWWGFPGDYTVLNNWDLETEAVFAGLAHKQYRG